MLRTSMFFLKRDALTQSWFKNMLQGSKPEHGNVVPHNNAYAWQALEEERDGLSHILGRERSHGSGLEQLIEASRLREASVAAEQRQLAKEKERLEMKVAIGTGALV